MTNGRLPRSSGEMSPDERLDALAEIFAEGFLYIAENGGLDDLLAPSESTPAVEPGKKGAD